MRATDTNTFTWSATGAGPTFGLSGGTYAAIAHSGNWNAGNAQLQALGGDGATFVNIGSAITADGTTTFTLPPGQFRWNITTTAAGVISITRVPGD